MQVDVKFASMSTAYEFHFGNPKTNAIFGSFQKDATKPPGMVVQIICQNSRKSLEEAGLWLRSWCNGWQRIHQQEGGRWKTHKADVLLSSSIWMESLVLLLSPCQTGSRSQWCIFISLSRILDSSKPSAKRPGSMRTQTLHWWFCGKSKRTYCADANGLN